VGENSDIEPRVAERLTFESLYQLESGTRVWWEALSSGGAFMVLRGNFCLCAYLGIPRDNPAAGVHYDEIMTASDRELNVHGGFTFSGFGKEGSEWPAAYYWIGWDYGHWSDRSFTDFEPYMIEVRQKLGHQLYRPEQHGWTVAEVVADSRPAITGFDVALTEWNEGRRLLRGED
jgi:hypothetical protein